MLRVWATLKIKNLNFVSDFELRVYDLKKMDRFGQNELVMAAIGLMALIAGGFLYLAFRSPVAVSAPRREIDWAAEIAAGTIEIPSAKGTGAEGASSKKKEEEKVDLKGEFTTFDGKPGTTTEMWTNFRNADYKNIVKTDVKLAESWPAEGPPKMWEIEMGEGYAAPVVRDGRVYVLDYDEEKEGDALRCISFDDGKEIWRHLYEAYTKANHGVSRTVPALTDDFVVSIGPRCHVLCLSRENGEFRWGIDMVADWGAKTPDWYTGQCPLVDGTTAVLAPAGKALLIGVDCETGEVLWETPNNNGWEMSHSSVIPMTLLGKKMYIYTAVGGVTGVSAEEEDRGTILWETNAWDNKGLWPSPLQIDDNRMFLTAAFGSGSMMLKLKEEGGKIIAEPEYELDAKTFSCEQQTPIFYKDHIFGIVPKSGQANAKQFVCLSLDGKVVWASGTKRRFSMGLGPFLLANDLFYLLDDHGKLAMCRASLDGYEELAAADVLPGGHDAWGPMALVDGKLILRDSKKMICLDVAER